MWCKYTYLSAKRQTILCKVFAKNENSTLFLQKSTLFSQKSTHRFAKVHTAFAMFHPPSATALSLVQRRVILLLGSPKRDNCDNWTTRFLATT